MGAEDLGVFLDYAGLKIVVDKINSKIDSVLSNLDAIPTGTIVMWSGEVVPNGWAICDGQNGTPDLRGRFIIGANDTYKLETTGGSATHTITVDELPSHTHTVSGVNLTEDGSGGSLFPGGEDAVVPSEESTTSATGGGQEMDILPPYYALAYIMKVSA